MSGGSQARAAATCALERIAAAALPGVWIELLPGDRVLAAADEVDEAVTRGAELPLAGRTVAVKGNVDVAGLRTTAGCPSYGAVAEVSAPVVVALEAAGAVVVGTTNLDQFATGLVGTRSPLGACPNPGWPALVSGGSSSGSAVAVAAGLVDIGVGTDTAGSGRVPAAANGIVGLKPTRGRLSTRGIVPACASLDCVSIFAATVGLAALATDVAAGFDPADPWSRRSPAAPDGPVGPLRLGVPDAAGLHLDPGVDPDTVRAAMAEVGSRAGAELVEVDLEPFVAAGRLLYEGAFVAERYAAVGEFVAADPPGLDPVVADIILAAGRQPAWRLAADRTELERLRRSTEATWEEIDVLVVPTVAGVPTREVVAADPVGANAALGHYTNFVNLLELCALAFPVGPAHRDRPPTSLTVVGPAWSDAVLVDLVAQLEAEVC